MLCTSRGMAIRFHEEEVRAMGRSARGVKGISLSEGDKLIGMEVACPDRDVLIVSEKGYGKRTGVEEYRHQRRGGKGTIALKVSSKTGNLIGFRGVQSGDDLIMVTAQGIIIRQKVSDISRLGRYARGVTLIRLGEGDRVVSFARVPAKT